MVVVGLQKNADLIVSDCVGDLCGDAHVVFQQRDVCLQRGAVALLGDAAHVMYPTGSNGASQAIMDARILGAALLENGVNRHALQAYDAKLRPEISPLILRNRGAGPFGLLNLLDDRCGGVFDNIDAVIPKPERDEFMHRYKIAAGFAAETLNAAPCNVAAGAKVCLEDSTRTFQRSVCEE